ncbi:hypothetical protein H7E67_10495 [Clostridium gasigenes]|uniref:hypothetical protein n=1 Tax=Clostridium gasigenes TaxID=94869 RepID=UPI00162382AD|nr:hypothetical protein [Clostridium gasigenes]MBB6623856.1 hypothetical protein [Clostridium gasigenes]
MGDIKEYIDTSLENFKNDIVGGIVDNIKDKMLDGVKWISLAVIESSYAICLTIAMVGLIFYCAGYKKGAKAVTLSIIIFVVLQAIKVVIQ